MNALNNSWNVSDDLRTRTIRLIDVRDEKEGFDIDLFVHVDYNDITEIRARIIIKIENCDIDEINYNREKAKDYVWLNYGWNVQFTEMVKIVNGTASLIISLNSNLGKRSGLHRTAGNLLMLQKAYEQYDKFTKIEHKFTKIEHICLDIGRFYFIPSDKLVQLMNDLNIDVNWESLYDVPNALHLAYHNFSNMIMDNLPEFKCTHSVGDI